MIQLSVPPITDPNMTLHIALTGGIGSGKSTASQYFQQHGALIIDSDQLARELTRKDSPALTQIIKRYGKKLLTDANELDRRALRSIIFSNPTEKSWLESLLHPRIEQLRQQKIAKLTEGYAISVIPLLIETGVPLHLFDRILVIDSPETEQVNRSTKRDQQSKQQIEQILSNQTSRLARLTAADDVIFNDQQPEHLAQQVAAFHRFYQQLSQNKPERSRR